MFTTLVRYTTSIFKYALILSLAAVLIQCEKAEEKKPSLKKKEKEKKAFVSQADRQIEKAGSMKVKSRKAYSHFYTKEQKIAEKRYFIEEINLDENGNLLIHDTYFSSGQIDLQWKYEYDDAGNVLSSSCLAGGETKRTENLYTYDENGNEIEMKDYLRKSKKYNTIKTEYNEDGLKTKSTLFDPLENPISYIIFAYNDGKMVSETYFNNKSEQTGVIEYKYDKTGNIIEENNIPSKGRSRTIKYILDSLHNVITIDEIYFRQDFKYDSSGNIISEQSFDGKGNAQLKIVYNYDDKGLMTETIKYAGSGKPEIYIKYDYEFYGE